MTDFKILLTELIADSLAGSDKVVGPFCSVLEGLGYDVSIDGRKIKAREIADGKHPELEYLDESAHVFSLFVNGVHKKEYLIELPLEWDEY